MPRSIAPLAVALILVLGCADEARLETAPEPKKTVADGLGERIDAEFRRFEGRRAVGGLRQPGLLLFEFIQFLRNLVDSLTKRLQIFLCRYAHRFERISDLLIEGLFALAGDAPGFVADVSKRFPNGR